eukprot:894272-Rhodomonas_salina.3
MTRYAHTDSLRDLRYCYRLCYCRMQCPVLRSAMLLPPVLPYTNAGYTSPYGLAVRCPVLTYAMQLPCALCGSGIG